jgi:hypothetical protein
LETCKDYGDVFAIVKRSVKKTLGLHRVGLMLLLGNLPINVGAFHPMGTNEIVLNRLLIKGKTGMNERSHVFAILLHEYLHSLGFEDEAQVRRLTYKVCLDNFGRNSPVVDAALTGPWADLTEEDWEQIEPELNLELVRNFERPDSGYII